MQRVLDVIFISPRSFAIYMLSLNNYIPCQSSVKSITTIWFMAGAEGFCWSWNNEFLEEQKKLKMMKIDEGCMKAKMREKDEEK